MRDDSCIQMGKLSRLNRPGQIAHKYLEIYKGLSSLVYLNIFVSKVMSVPKTFSSSRDNFMLRLVIGFFFFIRFD